MLGIFKHNKIPSLKFNQKYIKKESMNASLMTLQRKDFIFFPASSRNNISKMLKN